jgi:acylphosphatase
MRRAVHVVISGRVQGVGFRAFVEREAETLRLDGCPSSGATRHLLPDGEKNPAGR